MLRRGLFCGSWPDPILWDQKAMHARCLSGAGEGAVCMRLSFISLLLVTVPLVGTVTAQEQTPLLPLPRLEQCPATEHPRLADKWRAIFLMAPFTNSQLMLSEIEYDASLPANFWPPSPSDAGPFSDCLLDCRCRRLCCERGRLNRIDQRDRQIRKRCGIDHGNAGNDSRLT